MQPTFSHGPTWPHQPLAEQQVLLEGLLHGDHIADGRGGGHRSHAQEEEVDASAVLPWILLSF